MKTQQYTLGPGWPPLTGTSIGILTATRVAIRYKTTPTINQLMADFNMSKATAYRWRSAFKIARGEA
jgi:hypothetical protein